MVKHHKNILKELGPGLITGAADDDPSGITTYSQTGAKYGLGMLWTAVFMLPMMYAVQEMAARIGMVTGKGIARNIREHYPAVILYLIVGLLFVANTINLGADLGAIAAAIQLLLPLNFTLVLALVTGVILALEIFTSYKQYSKVLKWLAISLLAYVLTGLLIETNWGTLLKETFVPSLSFDFNYLFIIVGVLGTTISPFMMFWQANEEIEEEMEHRTLSRKGGTPMITTRTISKMRFDTFIGMLFSEIITWFIIVTTASTLHANGITDIQTAAQAAQALVPLVQGSPYAGELAKILFSIGIVGTGLLAVPIFAASSSYAVSEVFGWKEGLDRKPNRARAFYFVIILSTLLGVVINYIGISPIQALVYAAVINGVIAVPLIAIIILIAKNPKIMGEYKSPKYITWLGWITFTLMALSAVGIGLSYFLH